MPSSYPSTGRAIALLTLILSAAAAATGNTPARAETGINIFGFSHHLEESRDGPLREWNPGLGLNWGLASSRRASLEGNVGIYQDSFGHAAYHLSLGGRWRVAGPFEMGLQLINMVSASYNHGYPVVTPYPILAARLHKATVNLAYLPELSSINGVAALATYVTVRPWGDDPNDAEPREGAGSALEFTITGLPSIEGLDRGGFLWRHMFDDRRGLRLGCELNGDVYKWEGLDADGHFDCTMLMQYLQRLDPRGKLRPYWATGLQSTFGADSGQTSLDAAWRNDFGVEYALDRELSLGLEYGLSVGYRRSSTRTERTDLLWDRKNWDLSGSGARLALIVARNPVDNAGGGSTARGAGPVVLLTSDFAVRSFSGATFAWRRFAAPDHGWRYAITPQVSHFDEISGTNTLERRDEFALNVRAERLNVRPGSGRVSTYWGAGPQVGFSYTRLHKEDLGGIFDGSTVYNYDSLNRNVMIGVTALVGAEYAVDDGLYLLAEYSADVSLSRYFPLNRNGSTRLDVKANEARLGLGLQY